MVRSSVPVKRIAAVFNSLRNNIRREAGYRIIKWAHLMELQPDNSARMGDSADKLLEKVVAISTLRVRDLEEKVMG